MIVIVIGKDCVGKTYFRKHVEKQHKFTTYEASDYINEAKEQYKQSSTRQLLDRLGEDYVAKKIYELIVRDSQLQCNIVISGFRTLHEIDFIMDKIGNEQIQIVEVISNNMLCYIRNIIRNRGDRQISLLKFNKRQKEDAKLGIDKIRKNYKIINIENNSTRKNFEKSIDNYIQNLLSKSIMQTNEFRNRINVKNKDSINRLYENIDKDIDIER